MSQSTGRSAQRCDSPVFVLTASRSGSTLLRFILDSHPELACPPETSVSMTAAQLVRTWELVEGAGGTSNPVDGTAAQPAPHILTAVRAAIDQIYDGYLRRRGKPRWCDKSLDSYTAAELIALLYPGARFICLYRHCMDVIASGVEVCPWGLHRHGFDGFAAQYPGNSVAAIGSYWLSCVQTILRFEQQNPELCHRIRYEDLVTAPEETAAAMFSFLGVAQVPGITKACFEEAHEANGPGDEKIWFTGEVTSASMGRGSRVPQAALPPPLLTSLNEVLAPLGYRQIDDNWGAAPGAVDPRADVPARPAELAAAERSHLDTVAESIGARYRSQAEDVHTRWPALAGLTVVIVIEGHGRDYRELRWSFPAAGEDGQHAPDGADPTVTMIASAATWQALLTGQVNMVAEIWAGRVRCVNRRDPHRIRSDEVHAIAALLGFTRIPFDARPADGYAMVTG